MIVYSSTKQPLKISDTPMGKGGEGAVFMIPSLPDYCAKIYIPGKRTSDRKRKLEYMVNHAPEPLVTQQYRICWPQKLIFDQNGGFLGYVMPLAFKDSELCYEVCRMGMSRNLSREWREFYDRHTANGLINRLKLIDNIAIPIHKIHSMQKYVLQDFKPQNLMITADGKISMIDCDSIQISDGADKFFCPVYTPEYLPAELQNNSQLGHTIVSTSCDRFALAVVFYQILYGIHPYTVTASDPSITERSQLIQNNLFPYGRNSHRIQVIPQPHKKFEILPPELQSLFRHAFDSYPNQRPTAEQWGKIIYNFILKLPHQ